MAGAFTTLSILDGTTTARTVRAWDESGSGAGPFSFAAVLTSGDGSTIITNTAGALDMNIKTLTGALAPSQAFQSASAPVVLAKQTYNTIAASTGPSKLTRAAGSGAAGDWLDGFLLTPTSGNVGTLLLRDSTGGSDITVFSGSTSMSSDPRWIPFPGNSVTGAWAVTTGANMSVNAFGMFST